MRVARISRPSLRDHSRAPRQEALRFRRRRPHADLTAAVAVALGIGGLAAARRTFAWAAMRLKDRIIVAAGGGKAGECSGYCYANGGEGGGLNGGPGSNGSGYYGGGGGGTQSAGGCRWRRW